MFSSNHSIWKFADYYDELDDWLPYAKDLIGQWSTQSNDEVQFPSQFHIIIAAYLLQDDLLPASAKAAFAKLMLKTIREAQSNKLRVKCLYVYPPKPGRKTSSSNAHIRYHEVHDLIKVGKSITEAYQMVAEKQFKSPDTIRRDYERIVKKMNEKKRTGEIDR